MNVKDFNLDNVPTPECSCEKCVDCCKHRPCWGRPKEIHNLIKNGYAYKLMEDYWVRSNDEGGDIAIISPAVIGHGGCGAPFWVDGRCIFLNKDNLCEIHHLKPIEGKYVLDCKPEQFELYRHLRKLVVDEWDTFYGKQVVQLWRNIIENGDD